MAKFFSMESQDFRKLTRFYKRAPKQFTRAAANVLNSFAFGTRLEAIFVINKHMTVRSKKFVASAFSIIKARANVPINSQVSRVGSIRRARFTGWVEQATGKKRSSTRVGTLLSRGRSKKKTIRPAARMKSGVSFPSQDDFPGKTNMQKTAVMINRFKKNKNKKPFIISRNRKFKPGLYKLLRNKVKRLQTFDSKKAQPKKLPWMMMARVRYFKNHPARETWAKSIRHILKLK